MKSPIYVARRVLEASSVLQQGESGDNVESNLSNVSRDKWSEILEKHVAGRLQVQDVTSTRLALGAGPSGSAHRPVPRRAAGTSA